VNADAHHERTHAQWSASGTARNWTCSGALALGTLAGPEKESEHAARGTAAHTVAERCLRSGADGISMLGETIKTKEHEIVIDEELANSAQEFVDYVRKQNYDQVMIEQTFSLSAINPPFEAGGTCDAVGLIFEKRLLEVPDLKNGMGVVEVNENKQTRTYALCALLGLPIEVTRRIDFVKSTIVQPRAPHKDGRIRSETFAVADLLEWTVDLLGRMKLSRQAFDEFQTLGGNKILFEEWSEKWLTTGQCKFCRAEGFCPKLRKEALARVPAVAAKWFEEIDLVQPDLSNTPRAASPEELARFLDGFEMLESWIKAVRAYAHSQAENGVEIPNYQLADKIGNRAWQDETQATLSLRNTLGLTKEQVFEEKLRSPAQIEKILGAKRKAEIEPLVHRPIRGTNLVAASKTTRPPAASKVETYFEKL
jgi:Protein of unknown function (DUF2800)